LEILQSLEGLGAFQIRPDRSGHCLEGLGDPAETLSGRGV
jgi:hypothetical protein